MADVIQSMSTEGSPMNMLSQLEASTFKLPLAASAMSDGDVGVCYLWCLLLKFVSFHLAPSHPVP